MASRGRYTLYIHVFRVSQVQWRAMGSANPWPIGSLGREIARASARSPCKPHELGSVHGTMTDIWLLMAMVMFQLRTGTKLL